MKVLSFSFILIFIISSISLSNDLYLSKYILYTSDVPGFFLEIDTIKWSNSWRNDIPGAGYSAPHNHDAIWLFAKYRKKNTSAWYPAKFFPFANIPNNCEFKFSQDSMGVFVLRKNNGSGTFISSSRCGFIMNFRNISYPDTLDFRLMAVEMVYIPQDSFYVGDGTTTNITGQFCANDNQSPYKITSEASITLGGLGPNSRNNHNALNMSVTDDFNNTDTQILPAAFPKGFKSVYCMKYEVTSQQYTDFLNSLDTIQAAARFANVFGTERNAIQKVGNFFVTNAPDRANNFMSWADCAAYADWIGLRPMSELEMEKISRGPLQPVANEYAWGNTTIMQMTSFNGVDGSGTETGLPASANCNYNLIDGGAGQPIGGPGRVGIFATQFSNRTSSGSSYYGVMDMTGNVWERPVSVGSAIGRMFNGLNGDGLLNANGDANVLNWPPATSEGSSFRMGNWFRATERARISDRFFGATPLDNRTGHRGFRCVR
jgi:formylglycine-generating enzyme required for sulfatase activity